MTQTTRISIADDHALFRQGLKSLLALHDELTVVAETEHVDDIDPMLDRTPCDLLLLDLQMDRSSIAEIEPLSKRIPVIVVTASEIPDHAAAAVRAGARGVVFKRFAIETLMDAIAAVAAGHVWLPPSLQAHLAAGLRAGPVNPLTNRERDIVHQVALGLRNAEVAKKLFISEQTVKTHLNNIFPKIGVRDRVELTLWAIRTGIIGSHDRPG